MEKDFLKRLELEIPYRPKDETIHREFILRLKRLGDGPVALLFLDVTRQKNLENVRRDFVANVSHELRTPLNSILLLSKLLTDGSNLPPKQHEQLQVVHKAGGELKRLIDDVLDLSRIEAGHFQLHIV